MAKEEPFNCGLAIWLNICPRNLKKTKVLPGPCPGNAHVPAITIGNASLNPSYYFREHILTDYIDVSDEITHSIARASSAFSMLYHCWNEGCEATSTKPNAYGI